MDAALERWETDKKWENRILIALVIASFLMTLLVSIDRMPTAYSLFVSFLAALVPASLLVLQVRGRFTHVFDNILRQRRDKIFYERAKEVDFDKLDERFDLDWENRVVKRRDEGDTLV